MDRLFKICVVFTLAAAVGFIIYSEMFYEKVTVFVDLNDNEDPFTTLPKLSGNTQKIDKIKELDHEKKQYAITFRLSRKRKSLIDQIISMNWVENAEIRDEDNDDDD